MQRPVLLLGLAALLAACGDGTYTMYRSNLAEPKKREHFATFDTGDGAKANGTNCELASNLLQAQPQNRIRYWCEQGGYRK